MEKAIRRYWPIFVLPTLAAFFIGFIIPFAQGIYLSFCRFVLVKDAVWVGLDNYKNIFTIPALGFGSSFWFTAAFTVVSTLLINVLALGVALLLTRAIRGTNAFRTTFFMPNLIGGIVLGYIWQILLNNVLTLLDQNLLVLNVKAGFWGMVILTCWQQIGYMMIIYIAGLQAIDDSLLEAARIDGASPRQVFWQIKLPLVMPSITICTFLTVTNGFKLFDQNLALTAGKPGKASELLALNIFNTFNERTGPLFRGAAQAKSFLFFLLVVGIALIQLYFTRRKEVQQ